MIKHPIPVLSLHVTMTAITKIILHYHTASIKLFPLCTVYVQSRIFKIPCIAQHNYYFILVGLVEVSVKKDFVPRVTHGTILHQYNLDVL